MTRHPEPLPDSPIEAEERALWETHNSTSYVDWSKAEHVRIPNLKPSTKAISLRLPTSLLGCVKLVASRRDVPYRP